MDKFPRVSLEIKGYQRAQHRVRYDGIKVCSQTCKTFHPRCRAHIFSKIDLDPGLHSGHIPHRQTFHLPLQAIQAILTPLRRMQDEGPA